MPNGTATQEQQQQDPRAALAELQRNLATVPISKLIDQVEVAARARLRFARSREEVNQIQFDARREAGKRGLAVAFSRFATDKGIERRASAIIPEAIQTPDQLFEWLAFQLRTRLAGSLPGGREFIGLTEQDVDLHVQLREEIARIGESTALSPEEQGRLRQLAIGAVRSVTFERSEVPAHLQDAFDRTRVRLMQQIQEEQLPVGLTVPVAALGGVARGGVRTVEAIARAPLSLLGIDLKQDTFLNFISDAVTVPLAILRGGDVERTAIFGRAFFRIGEDPTRFERAIKGEVEGKDLVLGAAELMGVVAGFKGGASVVGRVFGATAENAKRLSALSNFVRRTATTGTTAFLLGAGREEQATLGERALTGAEEALVVLGFSAAGHGLARISRRPVGASIEKIFGRNLAAERTKIFFEGAIGALPWLGADPGFRAQFNRFLDTKDPRAFANAGLLASPTVVTFGLIGGLGRRAKEQAQRRIVLREIEDLFRKRNKKLLRQMDRAGRKILGDTVNIEQVDLESWKALIFPVIAARGARENFGQEMRTFMERLADLKEADWEPADRAVFENLGRATKLLFDKAVDPANLELTTENLIQFTNYGRDLVAKQGETTSSVEAWLLEAAQRAQSRRDAKLADPSAEVVALRKRLRAKAEILGQKGFPSLKVLLGQLGASRLEVEKLRKEQLLELDGLINWIDANRFTKVEDIADPRARELIVLGQSIRRLGSKLLKEQPFGFDNLGVELALRTDFLPIERIKGEQAQVAFDAIIVDAVPKLIRAGKLEAFKESISRLRTRRIDKKTLEQDKADLLRFIDDLARQWQERPSTAQSLFAFFERLSGVEGERLDASQSFLDRPVLPKLLRVLQLQMAHRMSPIEFQERAETLLGRTITMRDFIAVAEDLARRSPVKRPRDLRPQDRALLELVRDSVDPNLVPDQAQRFRLLVLLQDLAPSTPSFEQRVVQAIENPEPRALRALVEDALLFPTTTVEELPPRGGPLRSMARLPRETALAVQEGLLGDLVGVAARRGEGRIGRLDAQAMALLTERFRIPISSNELEGKTAEAARELIRGRFGERAKEAAQQEAQALALPEAPVAPERPPEAVEAPEGRPPLVVRPERPVAPQKPQAREPIQGGQVTRIAGAILDFRAPEVETAKSARQRAILTEALDNLRPIIERFAKVDLARLDPTSEVGRELIARALFTNPPWVADLTPFQYRRLGRKFPVLHEVMLDALQQAVANRLGGIPLPQQLREFRPILDQVRRDVVEVAERLAVSGVLYPAGNVRRDIWGDRAREFADIPIPSIEEGRFVHEGKTRPKTEWDRALWAYRWFKTAAEWVGIAGLPEVRREFLQTAYEEAARSFLEDLQAHKGKLVEKIRASVKAFSEKASPTQKKFLAAVTFPSTARAQDQIVIRGKNKIGEQIFTARELLFDRDGSFLMEPKADGTFDIEVRGRVVDIEGAGGNRIRLGRPEAIGLTFSQKLAQAREQFLFLPKQIRGEGKDATEGLLRLDKDWLDSVGMMMQNTKRAADQPKYDPSEASKIIDSEGTNPQDYFGRISGPLMLGLTWAEPLVRAFHKLTSLAGSWRRAFFTRGRKIDFSANKDLSDRINKTGLFSRTHWPFATNKKFKNDLWRLIGSLFDLPNVNFGTAFMTRVKELDTFVKQRTRKITLGIYSKVNGVVAGVKAGSFFDRFLYFIPEADPLTAAKWMAVMKARLSPDGFADLRRRVLKLRSLNELIRRDLEAHLRKLINRGDLTERQAKNLGISLSVPFGHLEAWMPRLIELDRSAALKAFGKDLVEMAETEMDPRWTRADELNPDKLSKTARPDQIFERQVLDGQHYVRSVVAVYQTIVPRIYRWIQRTSIDSDTAPWLNGARDAMLGRPISDFDFIQPGDFLWKRGVKVDEKTGTDFSPETHMILRNNVNERTFVARRLTEEGKPEGRIETLTYDQVFEQFGIRRVGAKELGRGLISKSPEVRLPDMSMGSLIKEIVQNRPEQRERIKAIDNWIRDNFEWTKETLFAKVSNSLAKFQYHRLLGFLDPEAAATNATQFLFTIGRIGPKWAAAGLRDVFTAEGRKLLEEAGVFLDLPRLTEIQQALTPTGELSQAKALDIVRRGLNIEAEADPRSLSFFLFDLSERIIRGASWLGTFRKATAHGYDKFEAQRLSTQMEARTMFMYDRLYSPRILRLRGLRAGTVLLTFTHRSIAEFVEAFTGLQNLEPGPRSAQIKELVGQTGAITAFGFLVSALTSSLWTDDEHMVSTSQATSTQFRDLPLFGPLVDTALLKAGVPEALPKPLQFLGRGFPVPLSSLGVAPIVELANEITKGLFLGATTGSESVVKSALRQRRTLILGRMPQKVFEAMQILEHLTERPYVGSVRQAAGKTFGLVDQIVANAPVRGVTPEKPFARQVGGKRLGSFNLWDWWIDNFFPGSSMSQTKAWDTGRRIRLREREQQLARRDLWSQMVQASQSGSQNDINKVWRFVDENKEVLGFRSQQEVVDWARQRQELQGLDPVPRAAIQRMRVAERVRFLAEIPDGQDLIRNQPTLALQILDSVATNEIQLRRRILSKELTRGEAQAVRTLWGEIGRSLLERR